MGTVEPSLEELLEQKKRIRSPLVPVGMAQSSSRQFFLQ
ncbi:hypothetical protein SLEP1_g55548 [Rubroshorea leprosula]|uniref:Uncharacterized protein n=1 Tax=Rubroshorea leprosula TaxID=152421 RepID=A0AAV5MFT8_9ROSI|nr:hypothetical protein SLEP1_g55548 [Rubroshorea leprosula]